MKGFIYPRDWLIVKRFQNCVTFNFSYVDSDLAHWLFYEWRPEAGGVDEFEKHLLHYVSFLVWGFHAKPVFFLNIFSGVLHFDPLIIGL